MKTEYLIHEYMWSNHCISGNKLGWGITVFCIVVLLVRIMGLPLSLVMGVTGLFEKEKCRSILRTS